MAQWPHAPKHLLQSSGVYMVTAGTYQKMPHFQGEQRLQFLHDQLLALAATFEWELHAWAVFSNHYHFVGRSSQSADNLSLWLAKLHQHTAAQINQEDGTPQRKVWHQFWDTRISHHTSYLARLNYVHQNPVKHGLVAVAALYPWCSAAQFEGDGAFSFVRSVYSFNPDKVRTYDAF